MVSSPWQPQAAVNTARMHDFWVVGRTGVDVLPAVLHVKFFRLFDGFVPCAAVLMVSWISCLTEDRPCRWGPFCALAEVCLGNTALHFRYRPRFEFVPSILVQRARHERGEPDSLFSERFRAIVMNYVVSVSSTPQKYVVFSILG